MTGPLSFAIHQRSATCAARRGVVRTLHGAFDTPAFMPVGTRASVKGVLPHQVAQSGAQILLNNTYHLLLRPGPELVRSMGGVHRFMGWPGPILTDSGGYQAYSLADSNSVDDDGVTFKSIIDGKMIRMTPEDATRVQNALGADIMMAFDDCPPPMATRASESGIAGDAVDKRLAAVLRRDKVAYQTEVMPVGNLHKNRENPPPALGSQRARSKGTIDHAQRLAIANERTIRWLERCNQAHARKDEQSLFGIVQGGLDLAQREWCATRVAAIELPGYAIGGVAVGETSDDIAKVVRHTAPLLPDAKPRYLMGVGYERDLLAAVRAGVDMFDCVLPTRNGRNANAFTSSGQIRLRNSKYAQDQSPIEAGCDCLVCAGPSGAEWGNWHPMNAVHATLATQALAPIYVGHFTRGYIRHLFMVGEMLGPMLVTIHNLRHFQRFMADIRATINTDDWTSLVARWPIAAAGMT